MKPNPIKHWSDDDKPREKLMLKGKQSLSNAELLAILIGSGSTNESAVALCQRIMTDAQNRLTNLNNLSIATLQQYKGIGEAKAITIQAALELANRRLLESSNEVEKITCAKDAYTLMLPYVADLTHEEFWVIYLNNNQKVLAKKQITKGGITETLVDIRLVFKYALEHQSTSIIAIHNHPSGNCLPSSMDHALTQRLVEAAKLLQIKLLDHIVITNQNYYSFADQGQL